MPSFVPFALIIGAVFATLVVISAWTFRTSTAPIAIKIILPTLLLAGAIYAPWPFSAMLGRPVPISVNDIPNGARFIALQMFDGDTRAQIWLSDGPSTRLYEITVSDDDKKQLRKARQGLAGGDRVTIRTSSESSQSGLHKVGSEGFTTEVQARTPEKSGE